MPGKLKFSGILSVEDIVFTILTGLFIFVFPYIFISGAELGCILTSGNYRLDNFPVLNSINFIYTSINPYWFNVNWLSDLFWAALFNIGHYNMLVIAGAILIALTLIVIFKWMNCEFNNWFINLILLSTGVIAISPYLAVSERTFSYLLIVLLFILLEKLYNNGFTNKTVLISGFLIILWANLGTDFIFGLILILIYCITALIEYLTNKNDDSKGKVYSFIYLVLGLSAASLLTPYGLNLWVMVINYFTSGMFAYNGYLASPNFHFYYPTAFFEIFILLNILLALISSYRPGLSRLMVIIVFLALSLYSAVLIPFFILFTLPVISNVLNKIVNIPENKFTSDFIKFTRVNKQPVKPVLSIIFIFFVIILWLFNYPDYSSRQIFKNYPVASAKYLKKNANQERIYNPLGWGCYLRFATGCEMFIVEDMIQQDITTLNDHDRINNFYENYQKLLDKYKINWIIYPAKGMLVVALKENTRWEKVFEDNIAAVYRRKIRPEEK